MALWHMAISDLHSGSVFALIPPDMMHEALDAKEIKALKWNDAKVSLYNRARADAKSFWHEFVHLMNNIKRFYTDKLDSLFILGDCIEGGQHKQGGASLVDSNIDTQADIATRIINRQIINRFGNPKTYGVRGTLYHVLQSGGRECEDDVYSRLDNMQAYDDVLFVQRGGKIWKLQHFVGRSAVPYGKSGPLARQLIQNTPATAMEKEHDADMLLFGHVHYCVSTGFPMSDKRAYSCPTLKCRGEAYGRQYNDFYDVGVILFKQEKEGAPCQEFGFKINVAYAKPKLWS